MKNKLAFFHNLPGGGGSRMIENIIKRYRKDYDIDLYIIGENKPLGSKGIKTTFFEVMPWRGFVLRNLWIIMILPQIHRKIATIINGKYPKIILTHDYFTKSPYLLRYLRIKKIYLCQEPQREFYEPSKFHTANKREMFANVLRYPIKIIDELNVKNADSILCNSKYSKKVLEKIYDKKCEIVYPGVDENLFKSRKIKKDKQILCVGGINPVKDQMFMVKALKPLLKTYKLILVGVGKNEYIKQIGAIAGPYSNIEIIHHVTDKELVDLYDRSMVTCISAHNEPFGLSSIESQACGTPVVSVNEGGPAETIINMKTGYLVSRNASEFRKKVLLTIKNHNKMKEDCRKNILMNWTWKKTLKEFDRYLK